MPATVNVVDQAARAALAIVFVMDQHADGTASVGAEVSIFEQHADFGGGSQAKVMVFGQHVVTDPDNYEPAFFGAASGSQAWTPYQFNFTDQSGQWFS